MGLLKISYCESVWAYSDAPWHVRLLAPDEEKVFTGGLTKSALCGQDIAWDIDVEVSGEAAVEANHTCVKCADILRTMLTDLRAAS